jgi:DNA polymerase III subunit epsilon
MKLTEPILFFDLETTGLNAQHDRIVSIALVPVFPSTMGMVHHQELLCKQLINPKIPISPEATAVHGITNEMVADAPTFEQVCNVIFQYFDTHRVIAGYNIKTFDLPMIFTEFARCGVVWDYSGKVFIDACNIFKAKEQRTLAAAVKFYVNKDIEDAHDALSDTLHTVQVLESQLEKYQDLAQMDEEQLGKFCNGDKPILDFSGKFKYNDKGEIVINFGKKCFGLPAKSNLDYVHWMLGDAGFSSDVKLICKKLITGEL